MILFSVLWSSYRARNQSLLKDYSINWVYIYIYIYIYIYYVSIRSSFRDFEKRIPLVMDDNEKDLKNGEYLLEWLCCCKWLHFSVNWRTFWITLLLVNLLFWGEVTSPQTSKIKSFEKIVFSNRSLLLQSAPS